MACASAPRVQLDVRGRPQARSLSCESRSACDLLGHVGIQVDEATFLGGLARSDNPEFGFVGSVDDPGGGLPPDGYGVYEGPIADRMRQLGCDVDAVRGVDLDWLRRHLDGGRPVIVWATAGLEPSPIVRMRDARGRAFDAVPYEHTFLAIGYGPTTLRLLDPATGEAKDAPAAEFDAAWALLGRRAVALCSPD